MLPVVFVIHGCGISEPVRLAGAGGITGYYRFALLYVERLPIQRQRHDAFFFILILADDFPAAGCSAVVVGFPSVFQIQQYDAGPDH